MFASGKAFFAYIGSKPKSLFKAGFYKVMKDVRAPAWGKPVVTKVANLKEPELKIAVGDDLSGVDPESVKVFLDGERVYPDWDSDASTVRIDLTGTANGAHTVSGSAKDKMGNEGRLPESRFFL